LPERPLPAIRSDCTGADTGVVDENIDATEPIAGGLGDLLRRGVVGQIGLEREQFGPLSLLTRTRGECLQRLAVAIDAGDPDACRQQSPCHCPADAARRSGHDGHS
jgi:hypothetical protein